MLQYAESLQQGETIQFRPRGNSMKGRIENGELVTVIPASLDEVEVGDVVLCKVKGRFYLHLVKAVASDGAVLIGNNKGRINGWSRQVYGKVLFQGCVQWQDGGL